MWTDLTMWAVLAGQHDLAIELWSKVSVRDRVRIRDRVRVSIRAPNPNPNPSLSLTLSLALSLTLTKAESPLRAAVMAAQLCQRLAKEPLLRADSEELSASFIRSEEI